MHETNQIDQTNEIDQIDRRCRFRPLRDPELKFRSSLQLESLSSAGCELQNVERIFVGSILWAAVVGSRADRDILFHVDDLLFFIHPNNIERYLCVLHPKRYSLRLQEYEEHAAVGV